MVMVTEIQTV